MDKDLDSLLDDALADFDKPIPNSSSTSTSIGNSKEQEQDQNKTNDQNNSLPLQPPVDVFNEFFDESMSEKLQEEWNLAMKELKEEDPDLANQIKMMSNFENASSTSSASAKNDTSQDSSHGNVESKVKEALESMARCAEEEAPTDDMMKSFLNLGLDGSSDSNDGSMPGLEMMEDMMKMMLSKDMLYPPMMELKKNYPAWLEENNETLSDIEKKNYENQLACLEKICNEFETESDSDSESVKRDRFDKIMQFVNEMQKYGQPPASLLGDQNSMPVPQENCIIS